MIMKPMLCEKCTPEEARQLCASGDWIIEQKVDGVRGTIVNGKLYDRKGNDITDRFPEFAGIGTLQGTYDGEIICTSNDFGDIAGRMHLKDHFQRRMAMERNPARFVLFDIVETATLPKGKPLLERKAYLLRVADAGTLPSWVMPLPWSTDFEEMWKRVEQNGWEGVVMKQAYSVYEGRRSRSWIKVKAFQETQADFTKFEENPKGITIETEDGRRVVINGAQAHEVKHAIIRNGTVRCNIQFMRSALATSDAWRFPSYRSIAKEEE